MAEEGEEETPEFRVGDFLEDNSRLITLLGVFGAISVYFTQFPTDTAEPLPNIGFVSALFLFLVIALAVRRRIIDQVEGELFDFLIQPSRESYRVVFFIIPFYLLILSVLGIALSRRFALVLVVQLIVLVLGLSTVIATIGKFEFILEHYWPEDDYAPTIGFDDETMYLVYYMFSIGALGTVISAIIIGYFISVYEYGLDNVLSMDAGPGFVPVLVAFFGGIFAGSVMYMFLALMLLYLHKLIEWTRGRGTFRYIARVYQLYHGLDEGVQLKLDDFE